MYDSETKTLNKARTVFQKCSQGVPLQAHSCSVIIPLSFLLISSNVFLDSALLNRLRVGQLLCLDQQPFFCINSQRILDILVKSCAVAAEFFYVDGWTDMSKLMFTFHNYSVNSGWFKQICQIGN